MLNKHKIYINEWEHISPEELVSAGHRFLTKYNEKDYGGALDFFNMLIQPAQDYIKKEYYMEYLLVFK